MEQTLELKLANGKRVKWDGETGLDAANRYVDAHPEATVIAWRHYTPPIAIGMIKIKE